MLRRMIFGAFAVSLASCVPSDTVSSELDPLTQNDWLAQSISATPVSNPSRVTLAITNGRVSGRGGCNQYSGPVEYGNGRMKVGPIISTKMACLQDGLMMLERTYLSTLQAAQSYNVASDGNLTINSTLGSIVFSPTPRQVRP